jgi:hypothetical protein
VYRGIIELNFGLWGFSKLSVEFRNFLFNFVYGRLYLNNVLHRIDERLPQCTFCLIEGKKQLNDQNIDENDVRYVYYINLLPVETVDHLFWDCEASQKIIQCCYRWVRGMDWYRGVEVVTKPQFFIGMDNNWRALVQVDLIWKHYVKFFIYKCRMSKRIPTFPNLKSDLENFFGFRVRTQLGNYMALINNLYEQ